jgi:hypothetical protein
MLALIAALFLTSPAPAAPAACLWYSRAEHRCRDEDVEVIGSWDPRPAPSDWPRSYYPDPPDWGEYPCERPRLP